MTFDIKQLIIFIEVADNSSFSKAAKNLEMAQASVSERVATLEKITKTKLFNRLGRKVELTKAGEFLIPRARKLVSLRDDTACELKQLLGVTSGNVKIGGSTAPGEYILPAILGEFFKKNSEINVELSIADSDIIIEQIENGSVEIGLVGKKETLENLVFKKAWKDSLILVASPVHSFANVKKTITKDQLTKVAWINRESGSGTRDAVNKILKKLTLNKYKYLQNFTTLGSVTAVKEGVKNNLGVAIVSSISVAQEIKIGNLIKVPVEKLLETRYFYLVYDKRRVLSPAAKILFNFLLKASKTATFE